MSEHPIVALLDRAVAARAGLFDARHEAALRLFNGFYEGDPSLVVDLYARTLVLHNYADNPDAASPGIAAALQWLHERLPWLQAAVLKTRNATDEADRRGRLLFGQAPDHKVREHGVWYAIDLVMNRDTSFYLDTRNLRKWAIDHLAGKSVLNTFAYTGSLGIAAIAAGARRVVQLDRNRVYLNVAKTSCTLNGFPIVKSDFRSGDFFALVSRMKHSGERFDCAFVDPPFFSTSGRGTVDMQHESRRIINKVRPLIEDGGWLVAVNNALFLSGVEYLQTLEELCADGYLSIDQLVPVPEDVAGYPGIPLNRPPVDPAPFNHPTKITILKVKRKL